jgi:hypothetical protein
MTTFLLSNTLLMYSRILGLRRQGENASMIGSSIVLHLGIQELSSATQEKNKCDYPLEKGWDYEILFCSKEIMFTFS